MYQRKADIKNARSVSVMSKNNSHEGVRGTRTVSRHQKWPTSCTRGFCYNASWWFFRPARKGDSSFSATASPDLCQGAAACPGQSLDQELLVHSHAAGLGKHSWWYAAPWGRRGSPCLQPPHDGSSQPKTLSLRDGTWSGPDTDLHSPDTSTDHQRPRDFWQCGCTVHSCTITAQIRDGVHYCEPQSSGENNLHSGWFISCLNTVSSHVNSCKDLMLVCLCR